MSSFLTGLARKRSLRAAGLMSGTSADGVDVALVDRTWRGVDVLAYDTYAYPASLRRRIFALFDTETARVDEICHLNFVLGEVFAESVVRLAEQAGIAMASIELIGSHGQTIHHLPKARQWGGRPIRSTLQIGEPCVIAERTGVTTVADFRPRDIAAGGEGAPLVPYVDWLLLRHSRHTRAVQNIGGIANVTYLPADAALADVIAFDTGPGNMVIDLLAQRVTGGRLRCDRDGRLAARGRVLDPLIAELMRHVYLRRRPPKSTGREAFGLAFADALYDRATSAGATGEDVIATATALTARSIARAYERFLPSRPDEMILCGGGGRNPTLVEMLRREVSAGRMLTVDELGIPSDAKEAVAFAVLACETVRGVAANVPAATGADAPVVLGKIVPGQPRTDRRTRR